MHYVILIIIHLMPLLLQFINCVPLDKSLVSLLFSRFLSLSITRMTKRIAAILTASDRLVMHC